MTKSKTKKQDGLPWGNMTPSGYVAKIAAKDGRKTNPTKNIEDRSIFR